MNIPVDARVVLAHLNAMGYTNITAEQLKEFIKDLKKLIKYENRIGAALLTANKENSTNVAPASNVFTKLHNIKTTSIQAKYKEKEPVVKENEKHPSVKVLFSPKKSVARPSPPVEIESKPRKVLKDAPSNAKSLTARTESTTISKAITSESVKLPKTPRSSKRSKSDPCSLDGKESRMWIRPRLSKPQIHRNKDAVQLYHFYQREWERFKQQLPGENDHSELRWRIRHKLMGNCP